MKKVKLVLRNSIFIKLFFILTGFYFVLLHIESNILKEQLVQNTHSKIELVISVEPESDIHIFKLNTPELSESDFTHLKTRLFTNYKYALFYYKNYVLDQIKHFNKSFNSNHQYIFILQRFSIWHQSSNGDIDPPVLS
jgi:hypothetical protein